MGDTTSLQSAGVAERFHVERIEGELFDGFFASSRVTEGHPANFPAVERGRPLTASCERREPRDRLSG